MTKLKNVIKLTAPSKESMIYRIVAWANNKADKIFCNGDGSGGGGEGDSGITPPKNSCQLFWQSIGWSIVFLNILSAISIMMVFCIHSFIPGWDNVTDLVLDIVFDPLLFAGAVVGVLAAIVIATIYCILTQWVTCIIVGGIVALGVLHYLLRDKPWEVCSGEYSDKPSGKYKDTYYSGPKLLEIPSRGCLVIFFLVHHLVHCIRRCLHKLASVVDCEDIT